MIDPGPAMLTVDAVRFGFPDRPDFLGPVSFSVHRGECRAIVGPNGAGKSTLLRLMAGLIRPYDGRVVLGDRPLDSLTPRQRARRIAFVAQHPPVDIDWTARNVVLMGRFPHRSFGLFESAADHDVVDRALSVTETADLADRPLATLSGGEAQRVHLAAALAQEPEVLLLDEPTASLDLHHQLAIFEILRDQTRRDGLAVVVVTHDVNLAARFCSSALLLDNGRAIAQGPTGDILAPERLGPVYGVELAELVDPSDSTRRWLAPVARRTEVRP